MQKYDSLFKNYIEVLEFRANANINTNAETLEIVNHCKHELPEYTKNHEEFNNFASGNVDMLSVILFVML